MKKRPHICTAIFLLFTFHFGYSQNGKVTFDTLTLDNGDKYFKGELLDLGKGSSSDGGYSYLMVKSKLHPTKLTAGWEGYEMKVIDFYLNGTDITSKKYYLVLTIFKNKILPKYICDPMLAKQAGEIK